MSIDGLPAIAGSSALPQPLLPARLDAPGLGAGQQSGAAPGAPQSTSADPFAALAADIPADTASTGPGSTALTYSVAQRVAMMNDVVKSNVVAALSTAANGNSTPIDFAAGSSPLLSLYSQYGTGLLATTGLASMANSQTPSESPKTAPSAPPSQSDLPAPASSAERSAFETSNPGA